VSVFCFKQELYAHEDSRLLVHYTKLTEKYAPRTFQMSVPVYQLTEHNIPNG